jgi:flagellar P-ring protein precursor FlgI
MLRSEAGPADTAVQCTILGHARVAAVVLIAAATLLFGTPSSAERIKDLASVQGVRPNQLVGYGIVVGLDGSGDQTTQTPFTVQGITSMLTHFGVNLPPGTNLQLKNVAAVMVTAELAAFAQPGQLFDVTVSSMGNAKSLSGGVLLLTPLKGADGQIYAMAQGSVGISGAGASSGGSKTQINHLAAGRIPNGATVERAVSTLLGQGEFIHLELHTTDFGTARHVSEAINRQFADVGATAVDGRTIRVRAPPASNERVGFLAQLQELRVDVDAPAAKVIINARSGSVVMNQAVTIEACAVAHGNLTVTINSESNVSQPGPFSNGRTVVTQNADIDVKQEGNGFKPLPAGTKLADVVRALNTLGATPLDLLTILQSMKAAGALKAELEII